jgi:hypothetical protein
MDRSYTLSKVPDQVSPRRHRGPRRAVVSRIQPVQSIAGAPCNALAVVSGTIIAFKEVNSAVLLSVLLRLFSGLADDPRRADRVAVILLVFAAGFRG